MPLWTSSSPSPFLQDTREESLSPDLPEMHRGSRSCLCALQEQDHAHGANQAYQKFALHGAAGRYWVAP